MTITAWDDYLIHQSARTVDLMESDDIDAMERLYMGCHNADGTLHFASGMGAYPNRKVMDGYVCLRHEGTQHNLRVSRYLESDRTDMKVGPVSFEAVEPQRRWRVSIEENRHDIAGTVEFTHRGEPCLTNPPAHYDQLGRFEGVLYVKGERFDLDNFMGARDRSWGVRPANLFGMKEWGGHFWIQVHFPAFCLTLVHGGMWNGNTACGAAIVRDNGEILWINQMRQRITFAPDVRGLDALEAVLVDESGRSHEMSARRISPAIYFNGGGYDRPGEDRGPLSVEYDQWDVSTMPDESSSRFGLHQQIARFEMDGESGVGILEASFSPDPSRKYVPTL